MENSATSLAVETVDRRFNGCQTGRGKVAQLQVYTRQSAAEGKRIGDVQASLGEKHPGSP
jgi:hypothetical protein